MIKIKTARDIYGCITDEEAHIADAEEISKELRRPTLEEFQEEWLAKQKVEKYEASQGIPAYISDNRWVATCPACNSGIGIEPGREAICLECGAVYEVEMPTLNERQKAEALLRKRQPRNRHWFPHRGETVKALRIENELHGVK